MQLATDKKVGNNYFGEGAKECECGKRYKPVIGNLFYCSVECQLNREHLIQMRELRNNIGTYTLHGEKILLSRDTVKNLHKDLKQYFSEV